MGSCRRNRAKRSLNAQKNQHNKFMKEKASYQLHQQKMKPPSGKWTWTCLSTLSLLVYYSVALDSEHCLGCALNTDEAESPYTKYINWEDAPASWEEYGHDNDPSVCGLERLTVEEWERGKYWNQNKPVIVMNVTDQWPALEHWKK